MTAPRGKPNQIDQDDYDSVIIIIIMTKFGKDMKMYKRNVKLKKVKTSKRSII